jgi:acetylornithine deacetylase/succinyl-diaminopimelate desuccinylase-like protein
MMICARYFLRRGWKGRNKLLFIANAGEEGLGNLKRSKEIVRAYGERLNGLITFDGVHLDRVVDRAVGSHRYRVTVVTEGGHSYASFGNRNAIRVLASMIDTLYSVKVPEKEGTKTTYNVGTFSGGTSVNSIAEEASFLCEYRSDDALCMETVKKAFEEIFEEARGDDVGVSVKQVGDRPCAGDADREEIARMADLYCRLSQEMTGAAAVRQSASTDCNIPLSLGIPAVCVGAMTSGGAHTTGEWLKKESLIDGTRLFIRFLSELL